MSKKEKKKKKAESTYTGGFIIILFIFIMTIFLIFTQPQYYHRTIILYAFGGSVLILFAILFSILQKPITPKSDQKNTKLSGTDMPDTQQTSADVANQENTER